MKRKPTVDVYFEDSGARTLVVWNRGNASLDLTPFNVVSVSAGTPNADGPVALVALSAKVVEHPKGEQP